MTTTAGTLLVRLPHRLPFAAGPVMAFHRAHAVTGLEVMTDDGWFTRAVRLPSAPGVIAVRPADRHVDARLHLTDPRDADAAVDRCRRLLDLDADPSVIDGRLAADPLLAPLVAAHPGLRLPGSVDAFETAVRAVLGQQISVAAARTFTARLVAALGEPLPAPVGGVTHLFPTAEQLSGGDVSALGLTRSRQATLTALAESVHMGRLRLDDGTDRAETRRALLALPGIGPWTAGYVALRGLADPDVLLGSDLAVRIELRALGASHDAQSLARLAEDWRPWASYATQHLWTHFVERTAR